MLIQPSSYSPSQETNFANSTTPAGVEQADVRADIPPVNESEKKQPSQNQQFFQSRTSLTPSSDQADSESTSSAASTSNANSSAAGTDQSEATRQRSDASTQENVQNRERRQQVEDQVIIEQLKARDREVRQHEAAHASAGGRYAGAPSFEFTKGPDGKSYATGGEVGISTSEVAGDPQATIEKARIIRSAALAPAQPSAQDRRVAAEANQLEVQAREDLRQIESEQAQQEQKAREAQAEQARQRQVSDETEEEALSEAESEQNDTSTVEAIEITPVQTLGASDTDSTEDVDESQTGRADQAKERPNALAELEKILLGSTGLLQQANQQGLVNPQNPYGKSGFLDILV